MLDKLTYPVKNTQIINAITALKAEKGVTANNTPRLVATAFPPLKLANRGWQCPIAAITPVTQYIIDKWNKEKQEQRQQLLDNVTQHINVIDKKNKCIIVINQSGEKLYTLPLTTKNIDKFAKKHGLEIL